MKRKSFFTILLLIAITQPCIAQVIGIPTLPADATIIRSYTQDRSLLYLHNSVGSKYVCLTSTSITKYFSIYPFVSINDIKICGDTAFFCGSANIYSTGRRALYGFFCISDVFYGTGSIHSFICDTSSICLSHEFTKIDVYNDGLPRLALIANLFITSGDTITAVASMHHIGSSVTFEYDNGRQIKYNNISCLNNIIVAVGQGFPYSDCITRAYRRLPNFVTTPFSTTSAYSITNALCRYSGGPYLIKHTYDNRAAIAFHTLRLASTMIYKLSFDSYTGIPSAYLPAARTSVSWTDSYSPLTWQLFEMSYNPSTRTIYLLENGRHLPSGTFLRWLLPFSMTVAETTINGVHLPVGFQVSLDVGKGPILPITSGTTSTAQACYYTFITPNTNNCQRTTLVPTEDSDIDVAERQFNFTIININPIYSTLSPMINTVSNTTECK